MRPEWAMDDKTCERNPSAHPPGPGACSLSGPGRIPKGLRVNPQSRKRLGKASAREQGRRCLEGSLYLLGPSEYQPIL